MTTSVTRQSLGSDVVDASLFACRWLALCALIEVATSIVTLLARYVPWTVLVVVVAVAWFDCRGRRCADDAVTT